MFFVLSDALRRFCFEFILPSLFKIYKEEKMRKIQAALSTGWPYIAFIILTTATNKTADHLHKLLTTTVPRKDCNADFLLWELLGPRVVLETPNDFPVTCYFSTSPTTSRQFSSLLFNDANAEERSENIKKERKKSAIYESKLKMRTPMLGRMG